MSRLGSVEPALAANISLISHLATADKISRQQLSFQATQLKFSDQKREACFSVPPSGIKDPLIKQRIFFFFFNFISFAILTGGGGGWADKREVEVMMEIKRKEQRRDKDRDG